MNAIADGVILDVEVAEPDLKLIREKVSSSSVGASKKKALVSLNISEFLQLKLPSAGVVLGEWFTEKSLTMIHAWRGLGKTWFTLSLSYSIACGEQFLKWPVAKPRRVLYLDGEMQASTMQNRLALITGMFDSEPAEGFFSILTADLQTERGMPDLSTLEGQFEIDDVIQQRNPEIIVIDNLSCLARSGRENEGESWLCIADWALRMRREGRSVIFVHHSGKSGAQRGTSKREDILDNVIALKKLPDADAAKGAAFEVHFEKSRHTNGTDVNTMEVELVTDERKGLRWAFKDSESGRKDRIQEMVSNGMSYQEIAQELNVSKSTVFRSLRGGGA